MNQETLPKEILEKDLKTKRVYFYVDENFKVRSKGVFKNKKKEIHYPFNKYKAGKQKYRFIRELIFDNVTPEKLRGVLKYTRGYGFTSNMVPLVSFIEDNFPNIRKILISRDESTRIDKKKKTFIVNERDYEDLFSIIRPTKQQQRNKIKVILNNFFSNKIQLKIEGPKFIYSKGSLAAYIKELKDAEVELSDKDVGELIDFTTEKAEKGIVKKEIIIKAKKEIDEVYIESVLEQYDSYLTQKTETKTLENKWQVFFKEHSWIFSFLFAHSMVLFQDQAYLGGQKINRKSGRYADFIYKNDLNNNVAIIEIKTHLTPLLNKSLYRKAAGIYSVSRQLSGALVQVSDQKDVLLKEWLTVTRGNFVPFEPKCFVIIGMMQELNKDEQMKSFELFRNNLRNIEIVAFDELRDKTETLLNLLKVKKDKK